MKALSFFFPRTILVPSTVELSDGFHVSYTG